jgi:hypothetical protein
VRLTVEPCDSQHEFPDRVKTEIRARRLTPELAPLFRPWARLFERDLQVHRALDVVTFGDLAGLTVQIAGDGLEPAFFC